MLDKIELRQQAMQQRRLLSEAVRAARSTAINYALINHFVWANISCVHCYIPHSAKMEVDTWPFLHYLFSRQSRITVVSNRINKQHMDCVVIDADTPYFPNCFGMIEPDQHTAVIAPEKIDVMILPLLACDRRGNRLGYGKGYYDRLLARCRPDMQRIGVNYFSPIANIFPEAHDIPLTGLMTAERYFDFCGSPLVF